MRAMPGGKPRPNHGVYVRVLRTMTPEQRLRKAFELGAMTRAMFEHGLRRRFPGLSTAALAGLLRERLDRCHNRSY
jgi:CO/xanthine dehydrogenase FAD-binding subunit